MKKIKQKAAHSNGYITNYAYTREDRYSRSSYYARSSWPYSADWGYDGGGYYYSNGGSHSNSNYTRVSGYTKYNSVNYSPKLSNGAALLSESIYGTPTITLDASKITYTDTEGTAATNWCFYYAFSSNGSTWGNWTKIAETTSKTYTWNVASLQAGFYKVAVITSDGVTWSATLNTSTNTFVAHHIQQGTEGTVEDVTTYDTVSYAVSNSFKIIHYTPPTWLTNYYTVAQMDQLQNEVNKARTSFGLNSYTFSTATIVADFTPIKANDITELQTAANAVYQAAKGSNYTFNDTLNSTDINKTKIVNQNLKDIQNLLDDLS